jgi:hypothetical protein
MITESCVVQAETSLVSSELTDETVILNLANGTYYSLDRLGTVIWELVQYPTTVADVYAELMARFDVEPERCRAELMDFLWNLEQNGLIHVTHG